ncbi:MAG: hypothetical protein ACOYWZ_19480 [Bacillota bacterium]
MELNNSCYLCKYILFFDTANFLGYYCTLSGKRYSHEEADCKCSCYQEDHEE